MKKLFVLFLAAACCVGTLAGCGAKPAAGAEMIDGQSVQTVVDTIANDVGMQMPADVDDELLKSMFYIDRADTEEYYGKMAMTMTSADNVVAVKAKQGKGEAVKTSLEKRLSDVQKSFEQYLPDQYEKAMKGQVIQKGDYVFLAIIGLDSTTYDADMAKVNEIINAAFK